MLQDLWYSVIYWIEDNIQMVVAGTVLAIFITIMIFVKVGEGQDNDMLVEGVKRDSLEEVEAMAEVSEEVDDVFSLFAERRVGTHEEFPAYEVDVYLKKPFITEKELKEVLKQYIELYKWKNNFNLSGLKIQLYDRKEVYEKNLEPRAVIHYFKEIDREKLLTEEEGGERLFGDDVLADNFLDTIEEGKRPEYNNYGMRIDGFKPLDTTKGIVPLTDQEFSFYLKMDMYKTLLGGSKYGGAKLYLQWDLGKNIYKDGIVAIEREFEHFNQRHLDIGGQRDYYDNEYVLKQELAVDKPQFLLFALTGKIEDDPLDAQRELIKEDPELFKDVLEDSIDGQVDDLIEKQEQEEEEKEEEIEQEEREEYIDFEQDGSTEQ